MASPKTNDTNNDEAAASAASVVVVRKIEEEHSREASLTILAVGDNSNYTNGSQKEVDQSNDAGNDAGIDIDTNTDTDARANGENQEEDEIEETFTRGRDTLKVLESYKRKRAVYGNGGGSGSGNVISTTSNTTKKNDTLQLQVQAQAQVHQNDNDKSNDNNNNNNDDDASSAATATVACQINEDLFQMDDDDFIHGLIGTDDSENSIATEKKEGDEYEENEDDEGDKKGDNDDNGDDKGNGNGNLDRGNSEEQECDDEIVHDCTQKTVDEEENNDVDANMNVDDDERIDDIGYFPDDEEEEQYVSRRGRKKKMMMAMLAKQDTPIKKKLLDRSGSKRKEGGKVTNVNTDTDTRTKTDQREEDSLQQTNIENDEEENKTSPLTPIKLPTTTSTTTPSDDLADHEDSIPLEQPSNRDLRKEIQRIFSKCENKNTITLKQFRKLLEKSLNIKLDYDQKSFLKEQLTILISSENASDSDNDHDEGNSELDESDYEENEKNDKKKKTKKKEKKGSTQKDAINKQSHEDDLEDSENESETNQSPVTRSKTTPRRPRKPSHLKIHHEMRRKKLLAEAKIRAEELQAAREEKLNEEDRKRAALIAKKFDTNTDEARIQRIEDRVGLLGRLKQKRLDLLTLQNEESDDEDMKLGMLAKHKGNSDHNLTTDVYEDEKDEGVQENEIDEDSEGSSSDDDDDELEIIGAKSIPKAKAHVPDGRMKAMHRKKSPTSVLEMFGMKSDSLKESPSRKDTKTVVASLSNPRAALRNALRAKQFETGNRWLAKELGYEKPEDHIRECKLIEIKKRKLVLEKEEERLRHAQERNERLRALVKGESPEDEKVGDNEDEDNTHLPRTVVNFSEEEKEKDEEEDEEMAMARQIESQREEASGEKDEDSEEKLNSSLKEDEVDESLVHDYTEKVPQQQASEDLNEDEEIVLDSTQEVDESSSSLNIAEDEEEINEKRTDEENNDHVEKSNVDGDTAKPGVEHDPEGDNVKKESRPRNAAWKAMLEKEKQMLKKQKLFRKGKTVDDEAEEEEEDEGVAGLEDFGFTVESKKKEGEDDVDDADEEDFENIVDEVSDGEGDEEAGEKARKALQAKEEKMRHKEVLRRIREGYDGKRGGVAGGGSKRGNLRFDQLVAADNKNDAKRLGLLNDDELDSEDEEANGTKEVEDEEVLIDRMLKERYLNKPEIPDEDFSDSDEDNDQEENAEGPKNDDDEEDREQERLAKRFAKRARMNRLLEMHGHEQEFTQSRLLDEDLKKELTKIRTVHGQRLCQVSRSTSLSSSSNLGGSSTSNLSTNDQSNNSKNTVNQENSLLPFGSTLSIALRQSRQTKKRKSSFLGGKDISSRSRSSSSMKRQVVSLGHVVFSGEPSNVSSMSKSSSNTPTSTLSRSNSLSLAPRRASSVNGRKRSISDSGKNGSSLWSKVSASSFRKRRKC